MTPENLLISQALIGYEMPLLETSISIELLPGKIYGITGPSGGGKSTLLKTLAGFLPPLSGEVKLGNKAVFQKDRLIWGHDRMAVLAQDFQLMEKHTAFENLYHASKTGSMASQEKEAQQWLEFLGAKSWSGNRVDRLSGGQRQRVALGRALMQNPAFLLLDEPTNQLDAHWRNELFLLIRRIAKKKNMGVLLVSHNPHELLQVCDEMAVMTSEGLTAFQSAPLALKKPNSRQMAKYLGYFIEIHQAHFPKIQLKEECSSVFVRKNDFFLDWSETDWEVEHTFLRFDGAFAILKNDSLCLEVKIPTKFLNKIGSNCGIRLKSWIRF